MYEAALRELDDTEDPPAPLRSRLWEGLGDVLLRVGDNEKAEQALRGAVGAFPELERAASRRADAEDRAYAAKSLHGPSCARRAAWGRAVLENAPGHRGALTRASRSNAPGSTTGTARWQRWKSRSPRCPRALSRRSGPELQTRYFEVLTLAGFRRERYRVTAQTVDAARRALAAARLTRDTQALMTSQWMLGLALLFAGDLQGAEPALTQSAELASKRGDAKHERAAEPTSRWSTACAGDVRDRARPMRGRCSRRRRPALLAVWTALSDANLGWTSLRLGEFDEARTHLDKARAFWRSMPSPYPLQWTGLLPYLELQLRRGRPSGSTRRVSCSTRRSTPARSHRHGAERGSALRSRPGIPSLPSAAPGRRSICRAAGVSPEVARHRLTRLASPADARQRCHRQIIGKTPRRAATARQVTKWCAETVMTIPRLTPCTSPAAAD